MSRRKNISIPDELWDRIARLKYDLNISKICADAIVEALDDPEKYSKKNALKQAEKERILRVIDGTTLSRDEILEVINRGT